MPDLGHVDAHIFFFFVEQLLVVGEQSFVHSAERANISSTEELTVEFESTEWVPTL